MNERIFGLDLMRASAIMLVLLAHSRDFLVPEINGLIKLIIIDGVDVFFVLSGFLIGQIILKDFSQSLNFNQIVKFWLRRWIRTVPNYLLILNIVIVLTIVFGVGDGGVQYWKYFLFIQNFASPHPKIFPEAWSLSVEEWFYLLLPLLIFIFYRSKKNLKLSILASAIILFSVSIGFRYFQFYVSPENLLINWDSIFRKTVLSRLDGLMVGILSAWIFYYYKKTFFANSKVLLILGLLGIFSIKFNTEIHPSFLILSPTMTSVFIGLTIPCIYNFSVVNSIAKSAVVTISKISYSLYLVNYTLIKYYLIENFLGMSSGLFKFFIFWSLSFLVSFFLYRFFELRILQLREKLFAKVI